MKSTIKKKSTLELPLIPLKNKVLFPGEFVTLIFEREMSLDALNESLRLDLSPIFVCQKSPDHEVTLEELNTVGTLGKIIKVWKLPEGPTSVLVEGLERVKVSNIKAFKTYFTAQANTLYPIIEDQDLIEIEALARSISGIFKEIVGYGISIPLGILNEVFNQKVHPEKLGNLVVSVLEIDLLEKQHILETDKVLDRLKMIHAFVIREKNILEVGQKVQKETQKQIGKFAREAMLREQMKAIEKELGMSKEQGEFTELRKQIKKAKMPPKVLKKAMDELTRLERMPNFSPESSYIQTYLEVLVALPWGKKSKEDVDLIKAKQILNEDHYGLKEVKERILEYLAIEKLTKKPQGSILCFVGPPGTGKTSIGESIAKATGREFIRVSLGGVRDETEIRGHRRTYVGAMPGRIIQGLRNAKTSNPVFMLDEIDKVGNDFRGDPSAALLEVLDPSQNNTFIDHYLDVPYDLSDIIFVATSNILDTIPEPLLDRMEIIEFSGYTEDEKLNIAKQYLIPRVVKKSGLTDKQVQFLDPGISYIIRKYTYEAGVRSLERELAKISRKIAKEYVSLAKKDYSVHIDQANVSKYLKAERYDENLAGKDHEIGLVHGLVWTPHGGDIAFIETSVFNGTGNLALTGQLGKVMRESAQAGLSYIKAHAEALGIDQKLFKSKDLHIHVPAGAIPKDGPSAGISIATSMVSALTKKPVRNDVAMTGEITLRGKVLPIGGLKNKVVAAHRGGIKTIILPKINKRDVQEIPKKVRNDLTFVYAETLDDVLKEALV